MGKQFCAALVAVTIRLSESIRPIFG